MTPKKEVANLVIHVVEFVGICMILLLSETVKGEEVSQRYTPAVKAVKKVLPWVVNIGTEEMIQVKDPYNLYFNNFFQEYYRRQQLVKRYFPLGSGIIIQEEGLIVTNFHVVKRAQNIEVRLWNGKTYSATLIGFDQPNDLCLLRLTKKTPDEKFAVAKMARANDFLLGETVITIGNPFGLEDSVSKGVLSAYNRSYNDDGISFKDIIQTDAAINPGNSGGPLVNLDGELMGLNLAIRQDAEGIGFAIPIQRIELFLGTWMLPVHFSSAWLGISKGQMLESGKNGGLVLPELDAEGSFAKAGLKKGDEIRSIAGKIVQRYMDFSRIVWKMTPGEEIKVVLADNRKISVKLIPLPIEKLIEYRLGLRLQPLTPDLRTAMGLPSEICGLAVSEIIPQKLFSMQNTFWRDVLKRGDIVTHFNGKLVLKLSELAEMLKQKRSGEVCKIQIISLNYSRMTYNSFVLNVLLN